MKICFILLMVAFSSQAYVLAQSSIEEQIKSLELKETLAVVDNDYETLEKLWAADFMVNNPYNIVVKSREEVLSRMTKGVIHYSDFIRKTESVLVLDKMVITMGEETIFPIGDASMSGETIKRRYTNIWREIDGKWQIQARHANIICIDK